MGTVPQAVFCVALGYWLGVVLHALAGTPVRWPAVAVGLALVLASSLTWLVELLIFSRR